MEDEDGEMKLEYEDEDKVIRMKMKTSRAGPV